MPRFMPVAAAATTLLMSAAPAPADPGLSPAGPADQAAPAPIESAAPPGGHPQNSAARLVPATPVTVTTANGVTVSVWGENEYQQPIPALTNAITSREYEVDGVFRGSVAGSDEPAQGVIEVGYQIGCGIDMGTGPGVLIGANAGVNGSWGLILAFLGPDGNPDTPVIGTDFVLNGGLTFGGSITVSLKPGVVNTVPVTKKPFKGDSPRVALRDFRVRIDGCVGESFIRSYAVITRTTDERDTVLGWYGETTRV